MRNANSGVVRPVVCGAVACGLMLLAGTARAGGPRFISGTSGYAQAGIPMGWYTSTPMYYTDPANLSATVTHAQADAMVAAAAAVWNVPTANITLGQGGELAEHVSGSNSYFNGTTIVFPADVQSTNYQAIQIPVVYDSNGSITDLLLGSGASDPSGCSQNAVIESVDAFGSNATIQHAVIVLNGRCTGSGAQQLTQMQYQLTRVFGRVLGLAWSQLNDAVFTGATPFSLAQMALWPLMHPIDVNCGTYTYQCMQNPFTLRPDDVSALASLYPVMTTGGGKTQSSYDTITATGVVRFPTWQGMEIVNVTELRRIVGIDSGYEPYPILSSTTGYSYQQNGGNPVSGVEPASENAGSNDPANEGAWKLAYLQAGTGTDILLFSAEAVNPLYSGEYAVGPYQRPVTSMSGLGAYSTGEFATNSLVSAAITQSTGASNCATPADGTEASPMPANTTGLWSDVMCAAGHTAWWKLAVNANTSWTVEMTALDDSGGSTVSKMQPVIGVWNLSDATGTLPTVAAQTVAQNSMSLGMTQMQVSGAGSATTVRIAVADQFGAGRPDFGYAARILYASGVAPSTVSSGGQIVISGMGFRPGNQVLINGVAATVSSWTATQIIATAPSMAAAGAVSGTSVAVEVYDAGTGGMTAMQGVLTYVAGTTNQIRLVSAPASLETGFVAATPLAVRVFGADGVTPVASASVTFVVTGTGTGAAVVTGCQTGPGCVVKTDATGTAQTPVMGVAAGAVTMRGTEMSSGSSVIAAGLDADPLRVVAMHAATQYLAAGASGSWSLSLTATQDGAAAAGVPVAWSTAGVGFTLTPPGELTVANGTAGVVASVSAIASGSTNVVNGCAWSTACSSWTVYGVAQPLWTIGVSGGAGQSVGARGAALAPVTMIVTDGAGHPLPGATVNVYQTSYAWEGACAAPGACVAAPVLATSQSSATSDGSGLVVVQPLQVKGVAQMVKIAVSAGTRGFASTSLTVTP